MSGSFTDERRQRATRSAAWTAVAVAGCAVLFGIPAPTHWGAPGVRAAIETLIATAAIISATLLLLSYREHRRLSDLLLLTALATVGVTDFVFSALPALTGSEALGLGSGPQVACDALAAVAFAAAALVPSRCQPSCWPPWSIAGSVTRGSTGSRRIRASPRRRLIPRC